MFQVFHNFSITLFFSAPKKATANVTPSKKLRPNLSTSWRGGSEGIRNPSSRITNYYGPYPKMLLESARFELLKLIDMREGYGYDKLKLKLGIYQDGSRDVDFDGWGDASDYFSCSGEPEEYLQDFDFDPSFSRHLNDPSNHNSHFSHDVTSSDYQAFSNSPTKVNEKNESGLNTKGQSKSKPVATVTSQELNGNDTDTTSDSSDSSAESEDDMNKKADSNNLDAMNKKADSNNLDAKNNESGSNTIKKNKLDSNIVAEHKAEDKEKVEETTYSATDDNNKNSMLFSSGTVQSAETVVNKPQANAIVDNGGKLLHNSESSSTETATKGVIDNQEAAVVNDNGNTMSNTAEVGSEDKDNQSSLNNSVIILEDGEITTTEINPIVIEESYIEAGMVDNTMPSNSADSPVEITDSTDSCEEILPNGTEMIIDLADSTVSDGSGAHSEDGTSRHSLKRKHIEEVYELEEGEIISSDSDDDDVQYLGKSQVIHASKQTDEPKSKKQNISNSNCSGGMIDIENNVQGPSFVIDRTATAVNEPPVDKNRNFNDNPDIKAKMMFNDEGKTCSVVKDDEINANVTESAATLAISGTLQKKYKCDYCPTISADGGKMLKHLLDAKHYSSSHVLVNENGKPVLTDQKSGQKYHEAAFCGPIPICPEPYCSKVFKDIYSCVFHYTSAHNKKDRAYALAELLGEDVIPCKTTKNGDYECEVCGAKFICSPLLLFEHKRKENHITIHPRPDAQTVFLCCDCKEVFYNLNDILRHRVKSSSHTKEVRVLHISFTRVKKKLLPFSDKPAAGLSAVENEIRYLEALTVCNTSKQTRRQITARIRDLSKSLK